uniref:Regulator of microtubule dynamics protein 3 n=1 Tax=Eptatretus burgeri TaxID=7764 RepID=A0A8C4QP12_EPTBU
MAHVLRSPLAWHPGRTCLLGVLTGAALGFGWIVGLSWFRARRKSSLPPVHGETELLTERLQALALSIEQLSQEVHDLQEELAAVTSSRRGSSRARRRTWRSRTDSTGSDSIYFSATGPKASSEAGYNTARNESDDEFCSFESGSSDDDSILSPSESETNLSRILTETDVLHGRTPEEKRQAMQLLQHERLKHGDSAELLWRMARAHSDLLELAVDQLDKKQHAYTGKELASIAVDLDHKNPECHKWLGIMCGHIATLDTLQERIKHGCLFKEHFDRAIELNPNDAVSHFMLGRWCYEVSHVSWIEQKLAAAFFGTPPSATVEDALQYFLKTEDLEPGFSKQNQLFLAKCYSQLGQNDQALKWLDSASLMPVSTQEGMHYKSRGRINTKGISFGLIYNIVFHFGLSNI